MSVMNNAVSNNRFWAGDLSPNGEKLVNERQTSVSREGIMQPGTQRKAVLPEPYTCRIDNSWRIRFPKKWVSEQEERIYILRGALDHGELIVLTNSELNDFISRLKKAKISDEDKRCVGSNLTAVNLKSGNRMTLDPWFRKDLRKGMQLKLWRIAQCSR